MLRTDVNKIPNSSDGDCCDLVKQLILAFFLSNLLLNLHFHVLLFAFLLYCCGMSRYLTVTEIRPTGTAPSILPDDDNLSN